MSGSGAGQRGYVERVKALQGAFLDAWVVVDRGRVMRAYNRPFFSLFPRRLARRLEGMALGDVLEFRFGAGAFDPVGECFASGRSVRYNEVEGVVVEREGALNFILAATPLSDGDGALLVLRDVTDEAQVQSKYKQMLRDEAEARAELEASLRRRTQALLEANDALNAMQAELVRCKKGLVLNP